MGGGRLATRGALRARTAVQRGPVRQSGDKIVAILARQGNQIRGRQHYASEKP